MHARVSECNITAVSNGVGKQIVKIGMEKKIYTEPLMEVIELEIEEVMYESGIWTDPFCIEEEMDMF